MSGTNEGMGLGDGAGAGAVMAPQVSDAWQYPIATIRAECIGPDGVVKWVEEASNLVTSVGKTDNLTKYLTGSGYTAAWYLVLKGAGSIAVGDTLASHAGWTELNPYAGANRPTVTFPAPAAGAVTSNTVAITINATATVAGAGICATQAIATTTGVLYNVSDFSASRGVASGDVLNVTVSFTVT